MLAPAAVTQYLLKMHDLLTGLSAQPDEWEAQYAAVVSGRCLAEAPASRASLFEVMEASLGIRNLKLAAIHAELEDELCISAPTEFEHYREFRLRTELQPIWCLQEWREGIAHDDDWLLIHDNGISLVAVSLAQTCVLTTIHALYNPQLTLAMRKHAYTELGLGQGAFSALQQANSDIADLAKFQHTPLQRLPKLKELFKRQETHEEQLPLWNEVSKIGSALKYN